MNSRHSSLSYAIAVVTVVTDPVRHRTISAQLVEALSPHRSRDFAEVYLFQITLISMRYMMKYQSSLPIVDYGPEKMRCAVLLPLIYVLARKPMQLLRYGETLSQEP